jgi:protein gp37
MGDRTKVEWSDATWNPVTGCSKVSAGCRNCYAARMVKRFPDVYPNGFDVHLRTEWLEKPLRWRKPRRVFVCSMSDIFHEDVPDHFIDAVFGVIWACEYLGRHAVTGHIFQILTKRPERMAEYLQQDRRENWAREAVNTGGGIDPDSLYDQVMRSRRTHPRIWPGVSVENQDTAVERIPHLLATPAAVRWLSCEPLLGPVNISEQLPGISWVVCGGESGSGARPMDLDWARLLRDQCAKAGVPFFFKQVGGTRKVNGHWGGNELDGRIHEEWPG